MKGQLTDFLKATGSEDFVERSNIKMISDVEYIMIKRLLFHWTLIRGCIEDTVSYSDRWCYATKDLAIEAFAAWPYDAPVEYEPVGWHRHPRSGRRREAGNPEAEFHDP